MAQILRHVQIPGQTEKLDIATAQALTFSGNSSKSFDGSKAIQITPSDLGLSQALKFAGSTTDIMTDGQSNIPTGISTPTIGDVVLSNGNGEFVWLGSNWEELGSENSYALKTIQIIAGTGLSGGGDLASDKMLSINYAGGNPKMDGSVGAGLSSYPARADHVHPSDVSKFDVSGGTITGATTISNTLTVSDAATFNNKTKIGGCLVLTTNAYGASLPSGTFDTGTIFFKLA